MNEHLARALALAELGRGTTHPNPVVGAVVVRDGEVVGDGWHRRRGEPHAEVLALEAAGERAAGSTLYTFFCPSRIKEFSHDQWCDQLGRSLLHYWAFAWKHRYIRLACAACYVLGGAIALWVIGTFIVLAVAAIAEVVRLALRSRKTARTTKPA